MPDYRAAAFHEAGHAVVAHFSRFHALPGILRIGDAASGETHVSTSRSKTAALGKNPFDQTDPDVARDLAVILCAGLASERVAVTMADAATMDETCSGPDLAFMRERLADAKVGEELDAYLASATGVLRTHWGKVRAVAALLLASPWVAAADVVEILDGP